MLFKDRSLWHYDLLMVLLKKELTVRYKGSVLGYFWSLMNPLAQAMIFYVVFQLYMRFDVPHYLVMLLSAMFPWQWLTNTLNYGPHAFLANPTLVKKVAFPRLLIPFVACLQDMVHFIISLPIYLLFLLHDGLVPGAIWLWGIPLMLALSMATIYGIALLTGSINLFFRDLGHLVTIMVNALFFATPVIYPMETVPQQYQFLFKVNPVAPLMICWRDVLYNNTIRPEYLSYASLYGVVFLGLSLVVYNKLRWKFAETM